MNATAVCDKTGDTDLFNLLVFGLHQLVGLPTFVLNIYIVRCLLFVRPNLTNAFYSLFALSSFLAAVYYPLEFLFFRGIAYATILKCPILELFSEPSFTLSLPYFLINYVDSCQTVTYTFITINRVSAVVQPIKHKERWKKALPVVVGLCFAIGLLFTFQTFSLTQIVPDTNGLFLVYKRYIKWLSASMVASTTLGGQAVIATTCTVITIFSLRNKETRFLHTELALTIVGSIVALTIFLKAFAQLLFFVTDYIYFLGISTTTFRYYVIDFNYIAAPWALVALCSETRQRLRNMWGCASNQVIELSNPTSATNKD